jgi:hypothetical protein
VSPWRGMATNRCAWLWHGLPRTNQKVVSVEAGEYVRYLESAFLSSRVRAKTSRRRGPRPALRLKIGTTGKVCAGPVDICEVSRAHLRDLGAHRSYDLEVLGSPDIYNNEWTKSLMSA